MSRNKLVFALVALVLVATSIVVPQGQEAMEGLEQLLDQYEALVGLAATILVVYGLTTVIQKHRR